MKDRQIDKQKMHSSLSFFPFKVPQGMTVYKDLWRCSAGDVLLSLAQIIVHNSFLLCNEKTKISSDFYCVNRGKQNP